MIVVNKSNFSVFTMQKAYGATCAPKSTFYADFRICLVLEGEAVWEIEDRAFRTQPGDIVLLKLGQKRHFTSFGKTGFKLCVIKLTRDAFAGLHHFKFFLKCIQHQTNVFRNDALAAILKEIHVAWQTDSPLRYELSSAKLTEFFIKAEIAAKDPFDPISQKDREIFEYIDYIDAHITSGINLSAVAQKAGMTESAFSRRFSAVNGISFKQYLMEKKIQRAIGLLQTTDRKMVDIALDCGFDSVSGFYNAFKKKTGTTPNKFTEYDI